MHVDQKPPNYDQMKTFKQKLYCRLKVPTKYKNLETLIKDNIFLQNCSANKRVLNKENYERFSDEIKLLLL